MKNLDRYTITALWLADFLSDDLRKQILDISRCDNLLDADKLLDQFCASTKSEVTHIMRMYTAAMAKISDDARTFGFAES